MEFELSRQIFEKYPNEKNKKIRPVRAELFHADGRTDGWTDRQIDRRDEGNGRLSQFCERA
jgi:hypothetical protein